MNSIENAERTRTEDAAPAFRPDDKTPSDGLKPVAEVEPSALRRPVQSGTSLPVLLTIHSEQDLDSPQPDNMELMTEGDMRLTPHGFTLTYQESPLTGMEGTTTVFEAYGPRVILRRSGNVVSQMVFEEGRQHTSLYETPLGELSIDVQTSYLRNGVTERGGLLEIRYSISIEHASAGKNRFRMKVRRLRSVTDGEEKG